MDNLTIEQRCEVAKAVTGQPFEFQGEAIFVWPNRPHYVRWLPEFSGDYVAAWQRSQALALVEYLIKKIWKDYSYYNDLSKDWLGDRLAEVGLAIKDKDPAALELLCYRMMEKDNG